MDEKDLEKGLDILYDKVMSKINDDVLHDNIVKLLDINYELGRASVYNENGWEYEG